MITRKAGEIKEIAEVVHLVRAEHRITPISRLGKEQSWTTAGGTVRDLFYGQLVTTLEGQGGWQALEDPETRTAMVAFVQKERGTYDEHRRQRNLSTNQAYLV